jgi:Xaa-Pro aminopeptidase
MQNISCIEKIDALRLEMEKENMAAYYIPTDDFHGSEYVSDYFKCREYLSGFTGSAGTLVVTRDFAGLWTDGRYFLQAGKQLEGTGISLMKMGEPEVPAVEDFLAEHLQPGDKLGFDGRCVNGGFLKKFQQKVENKEIQLEGAVDLIDRLWKDRPSLVFHPVWELALSQSGCSRKDKLALLRKETAKKGADAHLLTSLEDIAWVLNLRGTDIHCNPVFLSYLYVTEKECILFAGMNRTQEKAVRNIDKNTGEDRDEQAVIFGEEICKHLEEDGVCLQPYESVYQFTETLQNQKILLNEDVVNARLIQNLSAHCELIMGKNPTELMKAVKNPTELSNMRAAHIKDGVAVTRFIYNIKKYGELLKAGQWKEKPLTEMKAGEILEGLRREQAGFLGNSFDSIMAYGEHGAIVHYSATKKTDAEIGADNFLLSDTGGHYQDGTTDITRTIVPAADSLSEEQKRHYTLVLKANLNLLNAKFPAGVCGNSLDALAREPLWAAGLDFNHGTGHGVGYLLSVHEGPNAFRTYRGKGKADMTAIVPGMITSDEPGLYLEGKYGIRLENLIECVEEENGFYGFRPLTFVPFDRDAIEPSLLNKDEKMILNSYHQQVYDKIGIYLSKEEKSWLQQQTAPIG